MREKSCCFTGHRELTDDRAKLTQDLETQIIDLIRKGTIYFYVDGAKGFDQLVAWTITRLKRQYPYIRLIAVLPYPLMQECPADETIVLSPRYYKGSLHVRNRWLVDHSAVCVCYKRKENGGTVYTVRYAEKNGLRIISL